MSCPNTAIRPLVAWYSRVMRANRVVLPAPFSPSSTQKSPGAIVRLTSSNTLRLPKAWLRLATCRAEAVKGLEGSGCGRGQGATATPHGSCPTGTDLTTFRLPTSTTDMSLLMPLAV